MFRIYGFYGKELVFVILAMRFTMILRRSGRAEIVTNLFSASGVARATCCLVYRPLGRVYPDRVDVLSGEIHRAFVSGSGLGGHF